MKSEQPYLKINLLSENMRRQSFISGEDDVENPLPLDEIKDEAGN